MRIVVNGDTWHDGDLGTWQQKQPEQFVQALQQPNNQIPGLRALILTMAEYATQEKSCTLELTNTDRGWTLSTQET